MYCSSLYINASATFTTQLEALQNKSVRVILKAPKAFSVSQGKLLLNIPVLETYCKQLFHKFTCKLLKQKSSFYIKNDLSSANTHSRSLRNSCPYVLPQPRTRSGRSDLQYLLIV